MRGCKTVAGLEVTLLLSQVRLGERWFGGKAWGDVRPRPPVPQSPTVRETVTSLSGG